MSGNISFKNINIAFSESGKGNAVVLLHGFLENRQMWSDLAQSWQKRHRIIAIDLPGHGETGCLGYIHTMEEMADCVKAVIDHLRLRKVTVIGHSMGGYVALALAEKYPDLLRGLVLFYSTARADSPAKQTDRDRAIRAVKANPSRFVRQAIPNLFRPVSRTKFRDAVNHAKQEALKTPAQGIVAALEGMKIRPDREVILHFGAAPVMMVAGEKDPVIPIEIAREQMRAQRVTHTLITPNGHMGHIEDFDLCRKAIKKFLKSVS